MLKISFDISEISKSLLSPKALDTFVRNLLSRIRSALIEATPVDTGEAKSSWTGVQRVDKGYSFGNIAPYAHILETGSAPGKRPWPSAGPKTVMYEGRIYSSQAPGGIFHSAGIEALIEREISGLGTMG